MVIEVISHLLGYHPNRGVISMTAIHVGSLLLDSALESFKLLDVVFVVQCVFDIDKVVIILEETEEHLELRVRNGIVSDVQLQQSLVLSAGQVITNGIEALVVDLTV